MDRLCGYVAEGGVIQSVFPTLYAWGPVGWITLPADATDLFESVGNGALKPERHTQIDHGIIFIVVDLFFEIFNFPLDFGLKDGVVRQYPA